MKTAGNFRAGKIRRASGELWTSKQRQMHPAHYTISYRASFKPELPAFFIKKFLTKKNQLVLDPFGGRGTTAFQANFMGHRAIHNDINPVAVFLGRARQRIGTLEALLQKTGSLDLSRGCTISAADRKRLLPFFHPDTLSEIASLKSQLKESAFQDSDLNYIGLTALSRLYGHSDGFFSVYTFPQISILPERQFLTNRKRGVEPEYKNVKDRIEKKLRRDLSAALPPAYNKAARSNRYLDHDARELSHVKTASVDLIVTSPPFLDKVNYVQDNWMRAWFLGLEEVLADRQLAILEKPGDWKNFMGAVLAEMLRVLKPGARAVIEVGEVEYRKERLNLEELLLECLPGEGRYGRLVAEQVIINQQSFTKLANCWKVTNNERGTNTNRCLVLEKTS